MGYFKNLLEKWPASEEEKRAMTEAQLNIAMARSNLKNSNGFLIPSIILHTAETGRRLLDVKESIYNRRKAALRGK